MNAQRTVERLAFGVQRSKSTEEKLETNAFER